VCAWSSKALGELGPWLTRTATRATSAGDAHVDLRMAPLKDGLALGGSLLQARLAEELGAGDSRGPQGDAVRAGISDMIDFAKDMSVLSLDFQLGDPGATTTATVKLASANSQMAHMMTAHPERNGPAPALFWQLPGDADMAAFARGVDDADMSKVMSIMMPVLTGVIDEAGIKDADRKAIDDAIAKLASGAGGVYASGVDADGVRKALAGAVAHMGQPDDAATLEARHVAAEALVGWRVLERDEPAARSIAGLKDLAAAWSKPTVLAALRAKHPDAAVPSFRSAPLPKGATLPAGSVHYVLELPAPDSLFPIPVPPPPPHTKAKPAAKAAPRKGIAFHLIVAPDGQRTWAGIAGDETLAASRMLASMAASGNNLGSRADLASLKSASVGSAGFLTLRGMGGMLALFAMMLGDSPSEIASAYEESLQLPHQALSPIPFSFTPVTGSPGALVSTFTIPKGSIEDFVTTLVKHGGF
jgi:hypothetical protein